MVRDSYRLPVTVEAVGLGAHAHYLGRELRMTAILPGGERKTLLQIQDWDFAWQDRYYFKDFVPLPAGTQLEVEIHWDNSATNPRNPAQPPIRITWGEESKDEMGSVSLIVVPRQERELPILRRDLARRRNTLARAAMLADPALAQKVARLLAK